MIRKNQHVPARRSALRGALAAAFALAGPAWLSACGRDQRQPSGAAQATAPQAVPTTLTALVWAPDWPREMQEVAAAFTRAHPQIQIDVQFMIGNSVEENLKPKVAANQLPDLASVNPNAYAAGLADQDVLADVGRAAAWENMLDVLKPDWTSPGGRHFGVAGGLATTMIYYNKVMFHQAGIDRLPGNFEEFLAACAQLKKAGVTPLLWGAGFPNMLANGPFSSGFANNVASGRADWRQALAAGRLDLDTPEVADIFAKIKLLAARGYVQPGYMNAGYDETMRLFADGAAAMTFQGSWASRRLMSARGFAAGVFMPPWNAPGKTAVPVVGSETGFAVCNTGNAARQQAALQFLDFILGQGFAIQQNRRQNIAPMKRPAGPLSLDPQIAAYARALNAYALTAPPYYTYLPAAAIEALHPLLQQVLAERITPRQAAAGLDAAVRGAAH